MTTNIVYHTNRNYGNTYWAMDCGGGSLPNGQLVRGFFDNPSSKPAEVNDFYCVTQLLEYRLKPPACPIQLNTHWLKIGLKNYLSH